MIELRDPYSKELKLRLRNRLIDWAKEMYVKNGKLSDREIHEIMVGHFENTYDFSVNGKPASTYEPPDIDKKTIANYIKGRLSHEKMSLSTCQFFDAFLQTQNEVDRNPRLSPRFELNLAQYTSAHLCEYEHFAERKETLQKLEGVYLSDVRDVLLPFPFVVRKLVLAVSSGASQNYLRIRLIGLRKTQGMMAFRIDDSGKSELGFHEYFGIGVITTHGVNCHLRDQHWTTAYTFILGHEAWREKVPSQVSVRIAAQYNTENAKNDVKILDTPEVIEFKRTVDVQTRNNIQKLNWYI